MEVIEALKISLLVALCICASTSDIKCGIISNKIILTFSLFGLAVDVFDWITYNPSCFKYQLINIAAVAVVSIALYAFRIWAGGDCKLMIAISLLIPYDFYADLINKQISLVAVLAVIFGISYIYLVADSIIFAIKKKRLISKRKFAENLKSIFGKWICCVSYIVLIDQIIMNIFSNATGKISVFIVVINVSLTFLISGLKILRNKFAVIGVFAAGIALKIIFNQPIINGFMVLNYATVVFFVILRIFIDEYNRETISTSEVKKGMILSTATTLQFTNSKVRGLPPVSTEDLRSRLTEEEAESVRRWENSKYGTSTIEIVRKIPFAIFISIGTAAFLALGVIMQ